MQNMGKKFIRGAVIGGVIVFLWCLLSWMLFPWHTQMFKQFADEESVAEVIRNNTSDSGIYLLPNTFAYHAGTSDDTVQAGLMMRHSGPTMFASIQVNGMSHLSVRPFVIALLLQVVGAAIVTWMVLQTKLRFKEKVVFVTLYGVAVGLLGILPAWNWWAFSPAYTLYLFTNLVVGWFLAGLAIAKICKT